MSEYEEAKQIISDAERIATKDQGGIEFKMRRNVAGDIEYHRYEDVDPTDTDPARLTGIFTKDQIEAAIEARKEDPFYGFTEDAKMDLRPVNEPMITESVPEIPVQVNRESAQELLVVVNGVPQTIKVKK